MKEILILSQLLPFVDHNGGSTQIRNLITALKRKNYIVDFVSFNLPIADEVETEEVRRFLAKNTRVNFIVPLSNTPKAGLFSCEGIISHRSFGMERVCSALSNRSYSAIFAEFTSMGRYLRYFNGCTKFINIHELNFLRQMRETTLKYKIRDRFYLAYDSLRSLKNEIEILQQADIILSYNEIEVEILKCLLKDCDIHLIPLTIEAKRDMIPLTEREYDFLFLGNFEHKPNRDSALFLIRNYRTILGNHSLLLCGRNTHLLNIDINLPAELTKEDFRKTPRDFFNRGKILIAPVLSGGGSRVKIVDAMSAGNLIITTKMGAEGLNHEEKNAIFILSEREFISGKAIEILANIEKYVFLSERCTKLAETFHKVDESLKIREYYF